MRIKTDELLDMIISRARKMKGKATFQPLDAKHYLTDLLQPVAILKERVNDSLKEKRHRIIKKI